MELGNYRSANTPKKKRKKVTASAAVVFCILSLIVGIVCGKSSSSGLDPRITEMTKNLDNYQEAVDTYEAEIKARKDELTKIYHELAEAKKEQKALAQNTEQPASDDDEATESKTEKAPAVQKSSGSGILGKLIIGALVIVIIVCILFALSIFLKKNDSDEEEDDEYDDDDEYDEYYEEEDDSEEEFEDEEEEYDDSDEEE